MHHPPFPVGTPLIDDYILKNGEDLLKKFFEYKNIELIICGHAHGDYQFNYHDVNIEVAPATCFQFKKGTLDVTVETRSGYRIFDFKREDYTSKTIFIF
ncbi:protein of unknown function, metallo-dependent phosphatases domain [Candidatus Regiella insecticola 5.15]|uniref:Phosphohydrolase n=2 Tax=Candidatus Regiella insecticola TaxID=138073 RepID=G2H1P8_9ENTR|nr:protein of unknown function, metallo-dependent phosphatases domain [Candidatus Regiella insecticola 5.15]